jgi:hypothetical protein
MGQKKQKKKVMPVAAKQETAAEMELSNEFLRINLSNQRTSTQITDMKDDFNRHFINRLQSSIAQTSDTAHDIWQATKTPKTLCTMFNKISNHIRTRQIAPRPQINIESLNLEHPDVESR